MATRQRGRLFTCGRPGRATFGRDKRPMDEATIDFWVKGLPPAELLHIVSLLGKKKSGFSEFGYYPFRSEHESGSKPTFQEWFDERYGRRFVVHEFPVWMREESRVMCSKRWGVVSSTYSIVPARSWS